MSFGITQGIQLATGLAGMFGGKKKDPTAALKQKYLKSYLAKQQAVWDRAQAYDPMAETRSAVSFAEQSTGRSLLNAQAGLNQRYKNMGGSPTGDTNFSLQAQRSSDDILNPLRQFTAERASASWSMKQAALQQALGAPPGEIASAYEAARSAPNPFPANSQAAVIGALDEIFQPSAKQSSGTNGRGAPSTTKKKRVPAMPTMNPQASNSYFS